MEENSKRRTRKGAGRKPKTDPAIHRYVVRLNSEENGHFEIRFQKSGLKQHSKFIKAMIFGHEMKVVRIDKAPEPSGEWQVCFECPNLFRVPQNTTCYVRLNMNFPSSN